MLVSLSSTGGVVIGSRWPILREDQHVYRGSCNYADCLAAKGVKYARIEKTANCNAYGVCGAGAGGKPVKKIFNIFATHMQAWDEAEAQQDRLHQAAQMRDFVKTQGVPEGEPVIYAGDFNTDFVLYPTEVATLVNTLDAHLPKVREEMILFGERRYLN